MPCDQLNVYLVCLLGLSLSVLVWCYSNATKPKLSLPPGPKGWLVSGLLGKLPNTEPWKTYFQWSQSYDSPIISFRVYTRHTIILSSLSSIQDLLSRRSNIYSNRPNSVMYNIICGRGKAVFNISASDPRHNIYRRMLQTGLGQRATKCNWDIMKKEAGLLVEGLKRRPEEWQVHVRRNAAAVVMKVAFGYTIESVQDPFIKVADESSKISGWAMTPGKWMVDYLPLFQYVPSFFPGAGWKRQGLAWKERLNHLSEVPHEWVKAQMGKNSHDESFTSRFLTELHRDSQPNFMKGQGPDEVSLEIDKAEEEDIIKWCASALYAGAADTTVSALTSFALLMALHPEIQQKAQAEVDLAFGPQVETRDDDAGIDIDMERLGRLEYVTSVMKEVLRFAPVGNMALPHCTTQEDEYLGYRIPKGAVVVANVWAVMHDPEIYPSPFIFNPDRFLNTLSASHDTTRHPSEPQLDPRTIAFGFGRRICPGIHFAETTMLLAMSCILSRFDISLNTPEVPTVKFTTGITSHIQPFPVKITPRSAL